MAVVKTMYLKDATGSETEYDVGAKAANIEYQEGSTTVSAQQKIAQISSDVDQISSNVSTHTSGAVFGENGAHGLRYYDSNLEYYNNGWVPIPIGGGGGGTAEVIDVIGPSAELSGTTLSIRWGDPANDTWRGTQLLRKTNSIPQAVGESGTTQIASITTRNTYMTNALSTTLSSNGVYYYRFFIQVVDSSSGELVQVPGSCFMIRQGAVLNTAQGGTGNANGEIAASKITGVLPITAGGTGNANGEIDASKINGAIPVSKGGTGNTTGYVRVGAYPGSTIGSYATAEGYRVVANGDCSHSEGFVTTSYQYAHAEGMKTSAFAQGSHAEGGSDTDQDDRFGTFAVGKNTHSEGHRTYALGISSHAEGYATTAGGINAHSEGKSTYAHGSYSHAEGASTYAHGLYAHAEGIDTTALEGPVHVEGVKTYAVVSVYGEEVEFSSHAEGSNTTALSAHAEGSHTYARGSGHAEGGYTTAIGGDSHSEGYQTYAQGIYTHAEGLGTSAIGTTSHAEGLRTYTSDYSHAEGYETSATNQCSHSQGHFNAAMTTGGTYSNTTGTAFVIGNGINANNRSNAFSVQFDGTVKAKGTITASTTADYAEYFEQEDGNLNEEDRVGYFVTFDNGNKIKIATSTDEYILGVVSGAPFVLGNGDCDVQNGMVLRDEFNRVKYEPAQLYDLDPETGEMKPVYDEDGNPIYQGTKPVYNPEYDSTIPYINRADRPEQAAIGMLGVLAVRDDGTCEVNSYCTISNNGIATKADNNSIYKYRVIKRNSDNIIEIVFK